MFTQLSPTMNNKIHRVGSKDLVIPSSRFLEAKVIVTKERLKSIVEEYLNG